MWHRDVGPACGTGWSYWCREEPMPSTATKRPCSVPGWAPVMLTHFMILKYFLWYFRLRSVSDMFLVPGLGDMIESISHRWSAVDMDGRAPWSGNSQLEPVVQRQQQGWRLSKMLGQWGPWARSSRAFAIRKEKETWGLQSRTPAEFHGQPVKAEGEKATKGVSFVLIRGLIGAQPRCCSVAFSNHLQCFVSSDLPADRV